MTTARNLRCCDPCRLLHHKCDGNQPQCGRCAKSRRICTRDDSKRAHSFRSANRRTRFPLNQVWIRPPPRVDFVLESGSGDPEQLNAEDSPSPEAASIDPQEPDTTLPLNRPSNHHLGYDENRYTRLEGANTGAPPRTRSWPLRDPEEAHLLKHFADQIASFFDCTDRQQHFAVHIPYRARYCDTLFNAIMALSARHLSCMTSFDPFVSDHYYQVCLETLIPALNDHGVTMDDDLLAATVILRLLEEFDVPLAGSDLRGHSFGTKAFIQGPPPSATRTPSLRQAVYWSGLRQEIYNALSLQQAPDIDLSSLHSLFTALGPDAGDCAWANQAIAQCADVLLFCFGPGPRSAAVHEDLQQQNEQWRETRPSSFDPYFIGSDKVEVGAAFPDIRYSCPWHAIGNQYIELGRLLLAVHDPSVPTVGPLRRRAVQEADLRIRQGVWILCGVALSNLSVPPAMVVGCMAIHLYRQEQDQLIQVLIRMSSMHGWPTRALQRQLQDMDSLTEGEND